MNIDELFIKNKIKNTKQRKMVIIKIDELKDRATIKNINNSLRNLLDSSTVYRIIDMFLEKNIIERRLNYNEEIYYAVKEEHGHYFNCIKCHKKEKIKICPIEKIESDLENDGYQILNNTIQIDGICKECLQKNK